MNNQELIIKIRELIALPGEEYTDGDIIDMIIKLLDNKEN